jgi:hypothetical protein
VSGVVAVRIGQSESKNGITATLHNTDFENRDMNRYLYNGCRLLVSY